MQKIMFTKGLTQDVLEELKNMTRRFAKKVLVEDEDEHLVWNGEFEKPRYKVGEIVAVAQSYREIEREIERDGLPLTLKDSILKTHGYRNKMFVRAELMPHQIRITAWRRERLQDITDEDCLNEGIKFYNCGIDFGYKADGVRGTFGTPREAFAAMIRKMYGKRAWDDNPYVDVYKFEKVR